MRVGYVCRGLASDSVTGSGAHMVGRAVAMARAGHRASLVSEELSPSSCRLLATVPGLSWHPVVPERPGHWYFTDRHAYADRVYDTLCALHAESRFDAVELAEEGGEAFTTVRARRLLGRFERTCLVVSLHPWAKAAAPTGADLPLGFEDAVTGYAEQYCRDHADLLIAATPGIAAAAAPSATPVRVDPPQPLDVALPAPPPRPDAARTIAWLGPIGPHLGLETFLQAAALALDEMPDLRIVVLGEDTPSDALGASYARHLTRRLPARLTEPLAHASPVSVDALLALPAGTQCVAPTGLAGSPTALVLATAAGHLVTAPDGSVGAELVTGHGGQVVPPGDAAALATALVSATRQPLPAERERVRVASADTALLADCYRSMPAPTRTPVARPPLVSVIIPVYNQGCFLADALDSLRRCGHDRLDVVVVDDGSTDPATIALIDGLAGVTTVRQGNLGLSAARNAGIAAARGPLVLTLDADDKVDPGFLPAAVAALRRCPDLAFVAGYVRFFGLLDLVYAPVGPVPDVNLVLHTHFKSMGLFRREAIEDVGGYDESLPAFEDWEIQLRLAAAGHDSDIVPIDGQLYRRHTASMSFTESNAKRNELVQYLLRSHAGHVPRDRLADLLLMVVDLWKTRYEPSTSVLLQRGAAAQARRP